MHSGTLITELMETVVRAELHSGMARTEHAEPFAGELRAVYAFEPSRTAELVEVA